MKEFGCDLMVYVVEETVKEGIYMFLAEGIDKKTKKPWKKPYIGKTKRTLRQRLKEHLDRSEWKNKTRKKLKHMDDVFEMFSFGIGEELLEAMEHFLLDSIGGVENTANQKRPMGGRPKKYKTDMKLIKDIICKSKR